jgi:RNA polymerase sigma-70 factor (ECF subfamily)
VRVLSYREASDEQLVLAALIADFCAFDELIRRYRPAVTLTALGIVSSRAIAEDIAQDAFLVAFQTLPSLDDPRRFGGWVRAITRFRAIRAAERERRSQPTECEPLEALVNQDSGMTTCGEPLDRLEKQAERDALLGAMQRLTPEHREALQLHYGQEWPLEQIAAYLSVPPSTVKGRLFRAREALRRHLQADRTFDDLTKRK